MLDEYGWMKGVNEGVFPHVYIMFVRFQIQSFDEGSVVSGTTGGPENMGKTLKLHNI